MALEEELLQCDCNLEHFQLPCWGCHCQSTSRHGNLEQMGNRRVEPSTHQLLDRKNRERTKCILPLSLSVNGTEALLCCCIVLAIDYLHCKYCTVVFAMTRQWTKRPKALTPSALATHKWRLTTMPMGREGPKCTVQLVPKNHLISDIVIYFYRLHNEGGGCGPITVCR